MGIIRAEGLVGAGIDALADELLAEMGVPVVLNLVVGPPGDPARDQRPPIAEEAVEAEDEVLLVGGDVAALDGGAEIVHPAEAAAFAAAEETGSLGEGAPSAFSLFLDALGEELVFFGSPGPSLEPYFGAAGGGLGSCPGRRLRRLSHTSTLDLRYKRLGVSAYVTKWCAHICKLPESQLSSPYDMHLPIPPIPPSHALSQPYSLYFLLR